jgi:hypothetical protein
MVLATGYCNNAGCKNRITDNSPNKFQCSESCRREVAAKWAAIRAEEKRQKNIEDDWHDYYASQE